MARNKVAPVLSNELPPYTESYNLYTEMPKMGIQPKVYNNLCKAAQERKALIFIRKTNPGSVLPFFEKTGTGKALAVKGKSSDKPFTAGAIPFLASLSKKVVPDTFKDDQEKLTKAAQWEAPTLEKPFSVFTYIPCLIPASKLQRVLEKFGNKLEDQNIAGENKKYMYKPDGAAPGYQYYLEKLISFDDAQTKWTYIYRQKYSQQALVPQIMPSGALEETYYQVYIQADRAVNMADPSSPPAASIAPGQRASQNDRGRSRALTNSPNIQQVQPAIRYAQGISDDFGTYFAPIMTFDNMHYCAVYVLAQGINEGTDEQPDLKYYQVVADYDVFCVCPKLDTMERMYSTETVGRKIKMKHSDGTETIHDSSITYSLFNNKVNTQGLISPFERRVKSSINKKLRLNDSNEPSGSKIQAVIHGSEVNNYFYTEDFDSLIFIPDTPDFYSHRSDVEVANTKFAVRSQTFLDLSYQGQKFSEPTDTSINDVTSKTWTAKDLGFYLSYCFFYNMSWAHDYSDKKNRLPIATKAIQERIGALSRIGGDNVQTLFGTMLKNTLTTIKGSASNSNSTTSDTLVSHHIARLMIYSDHYSSLFGLLLAYDRHSKPEEQQKHEQEKRDAAKWVQAGFVVLEGHVKTFKTYLNKIPPQTAWVSSLQTYQEQITKIYSNLTSRLDEMHKAGLS